MKAQIYKTKSGNQKGCWRWRIKSRNGRIVANSGEGFTSWVKALRSIERLTTSIITIE